MKGYMDTIDRINQRLRRLPSIKEEWTRLNDNVERYKKIYEQLKIDHAGNRDAAGKKDTVRCGSRLC